LLRSGLMPSPGLDLIVPVELMTGVEGVFENYG